MSAPERFLWQPGDVTIIRAGKQIAFARETKVVVGPYLAERDGRIVPVEGYAYFREGANIEFLDVPTHVADLNDAASLLWAAEMRDQGVTVEALADEISKMLTPEKLDEGRVWYPDALNAAADISKASGMELDRVVTAIAVMSPRCQWEDPESGEGEKKYVRSLAKFVTDGHTDGLSADEAAVAWKKHYKATNTVLGLVKGKRTGDPVGASVFNNNTAKAIQVMRGEITPAEMLKDNKTRSFYNNILFPEDQDAVTIDTHMMKVLERVYGVTYKDADVFVRHDRKIPKGGGQVRGVGYIAISEAIRMVAENMEPPETPNTVQAAYWLRMQEEPHILKNGSPWPGRDPVMAFARALDYLDTDFELLPAYSPEEVAQNRLTDEEVEEAFKREQEAADAWEPPVGLAMAEVFVPRHPRFKRGRVEDVDPYTYRRDVVGKRGARALVREGGFSLSRNGHEPKGGFMVAIPGNEEVLDEGEVGTQALGEYMSRHKAALNKPGSYLGGWVDHETRKVYLDVAENVTSEDEARRRGKERGEIAIYDIGGNQEVRLARGHEGHTLVFLPKDDPAEAARLLKEVLGERPA